MCIDRGWTAFVVDQAFGYLQDSHTSVVGMREVVAVRCTSVNCWTWQQLNAALEDDASCPDQPDRDRHSLFVLTAMSNFCGFKYPLDVIERIRRCRIGSLMINALN